MKLRREKTPHVHPGKVRVLIQDISGNAGFYTCKDKITAIPKSGGGKHITLYETSVEDVFKIIIKALEREAEK